MTFGNAKKQVLIVALAAVAMGLSATVAQATILVNFIPEPASPATSEFEWDGSTLVDGPGALGTGFGNTDPGDGDDPVGSQDIPGLAMNTPFEISGVPGSIEGTGNTTFYDTTLDILGSGLPEAGDAFPLLGMITQPLGGGAFELWSTDPAPGDPDAPTLLLAGTVDTAFITGIAGSTTGATLSATVTYTDGVIYDAALATLLSAPLTGSFAWTLEDMSAPLTIGGSDRIEPFTANGTGQFSGIPEPGTLVLLGIGGLMMAARRRRMRA